ncbi:MAG: GNAT family N-acetyltransferase [Clostridiales bacterium]|nr:GNAT family N-acetyltransferase [Clostridiales bacterium]
MSLKDFINDKPVINTERLELRTLTAEDVPALREWLTEPSIYRYWGSNCGKNDKNPELMFEKSPKPTKSFHWGIVLTAENKAIGEMWVYLIENDRMAKVAYRVNPRYHGNGYASEALSAAVNFCFSQTELRRLWTYVDVRNTPSARVLEKCGFTREGLVRQGKMGSTWCDYYIYGRLKEDM